MQIITEIDVVALIKRTFPNFGDIPVATSFTQSGLLTSMDLITLIFEIEKEFNITFDMSEMDLKKIDSPIIIAETINVMRGINNLTIKNLFDDICQNNLDAEAITFNDETFTYNEIYNKVRKLAAGFLANGIEKGTNTVIVLENSIEYILSYFALFYIGAIPVPINTRWNCSEAIKVITNSNAAYFIANEHTGKLKFSEILRELEKSNHGVTKVFYCDDTVAENCCSFAELLKGGLVEIPNNIDGSDVAMISYTSGTTGTPKGVMLRHCDIAKISLYTARVWAVKKDTSFSIAPLYSAQGFLSLIINFCLESRFKMISSFNTNDIIKEISKETKQFFTHSQLCGQCF